MVRESGKGELGTVEVKLKDVQAAFKDIKRSLDALSAALEKTADPIHGTVKVPGGGGPGPWVPGLCGDPGGDPGWICPVLDDLVRFLRQLCKAVSEPAGRPDRRRAP
jgi:hypothetical protein